MPGPPHEHPNEYGASNLVVHMDRSVIKLYLWKETRSLWPQNGVNKPYHRQNRWYALRPQSSRTPRVIYFYQKYPARTNAMQVKIQSESFPALQSALCAHPTSHALSYGQIPAYQTTVYPQDLP